MQTLRYAAYACVYTWVISCHIHSHSRERERESSPGGGARCCWLVGGKTAGEVECSENGWVGGLLRLGGGGKGPYPKVEYLLVGFI